MVGPRFEEWRSVPQHVRRGFAESVARSRRCGIRVTRICLKVDDVATVLAGGRQRRGSEMNESNPRPAESTANCDCSCIDCQPPCAASWRSQLPSMGEKRGLE